MTYLTTADLAVLTRSPAETVRYWRYMKTGPAWFKIGRRVLYDADVVAAWINEAQERHAQGSRDGANHPVQSCTQSAAS